VASVLQRSPVRWLTRRAAFVSLPLAVLVIVGTTVLVAHSGSSQPLTLTAHRSQCPTHTQTLPRNSATARANTRTSSTSKGDLFRICGDSKNAFTLTFGRPYGPSKNGCPVRRPRPVNPTQHTPNMIRQRSPLHRPRQPPTTVTG
jgi:hypothetical protein